ncbi:MAG: hypothetical protein ACTHL8_03255 [Burkholderiaceae bacterium]
MAINRLNHGTAARAAAHASAPVAPTGPAREPDAKERDPLAHHHGHHVHEHGARHAHPHPAGHGPTPRPRRANSKGQARRRSRSTALSGDDEDMDFAEDDEGDGIAPVSSSGHGGDASGGDGGGGGGGHDRQKHDDGSGGGDSGRPGPGGARADAPPSVRRVQGLVSGAQQRLAADRHKAASCRLVAGWQPGAAVAAALHADRLAAMRACGDVSRMEPKSTAGEYDQMADYLVASRGAAAGASTMFNLMLPIWLLSMSTPRTKSRRDHAISVLEVRGKAREGKEE